MAAEPTRRSAAHRRRFLSRSVEATERVGEAIGRRLGAGAVVALTGDLGAGKTAFVRGLARGLDVVDPVTSPTFTLMHEADGRVPLYHFDAWMSGRETHFLEGGGAEYLGGAGVAAVEWAERVEPWLPGPRLEVRLRHRGPDEREIEVAVLPGESRDGREAALQRALEAAVGAVEAPGERGELEELVRSAPGPSPEPPGDPPREPPGARRVGKGG